MVYGPHGAPDFFTHEDIEMFFATAWKVHYNSDRTGVRLIGPKPTWARKDGGEAGLHPSNIHDNAYAVGTVDFTGDMPVILGPDGPSLGGFVCPATIRHAELWKIGQLRPGDLVRFRRGERRRSPILRAGARAWSAAPMAIARCWSSTAPTCSISTCASAPTPWNRNCAPPTSPASSTSRPAYARCRFITTPRYLDRETLLDALDACERQIPDLDDISAPSRIVHLPLSWDDPATLLAIRKYMQSVRPDAPWCPSNIEFIRRINGLDSIDDVRRIVFDANYLVLGLGDVYLGAPVATPVDPRHRLVTTKYNPARTWTPENAVGIGGAYMCVYGMEGPGGYQFVGRTLQMWNTFHASPALAAALLRSDPLLRGQRPGAAGNSRGLSARRLSAAHRRDRNSASRITTRSSIPSAARARNSRAGSRRHLRPSANAGRSPARTSSSRLRRTARARSYRWMRSRKVAAGSVRR